ncbi:PIG-L family deacetylase [Gephyromycinifex aptenodytis]|uniref:PIG-L family deacetylase n=1 Tax=Gephyromycinifex aptenodytis TaxID=2716227 RepID=UPI0014460781|nr:PIG-L family deacetylase [Gephyromycinifex aptenodytis]
MNSHAATRLVFVHAHPDDETLATGVALAMHALAGHEVTVLTATLGDEGEVIPPQLRYLDVEHTDRLGPYRRTELAAATAQLGVRSLVLGDPDPAPSGQCGARYRDSGMVGTSANGRSGALCTVDTADVLADLVATLDALDPDILVTYDHSGGYGHPDHIRVHQLTVAAAARLRRVPSLYAAVVPQSWAQERRAWVRQQVRGDFTLLGQDEPYPPSVVADDAFAHLIVGTPEALARRDAALRAHRTQVEVHDGFYALSNKIATALPDREAYVQLHPGTGQVLPCPPEPVTGLLRGQEDVS